MCPRTERRSDELDVDLLISALRRFGSVTVQADGESMQPAIPAGSTLVVDSVKPDDVLIGDVVAVVIGARLFLHRVIADMGDHLVTAGDNLPLLDPPVRRSQVLGVVPGHRGPATQPIQVIRSGPVPPDVELWVFGTEQVVVPRSWRVRRRDCRSQRINPADTPSSVEGAVLHVGVSEYGRTPVEALTGVGGRLQVIIGAPFGGLPDDSAGCTPLSPSAVDIHVRVGEPTVPVALPEAVRRIVEVFGASAECMEVAS